MTSTGAASRSGTAHAARADAGASARAAAASVTARRDIFPTDPPAFARVWAIDHAASVIAMRVVLLTITAAIALAAPAGAAFSGDDGRIVFTTGGHDLRTVAPGGGAWTTVPLPSGLRAGQAAWSPDGTRIAFRGGPDGDSEIWVVRPDGSGLTKLTDTPNVSGDNRFSSQPAWSPDGTRIVFRSDREDGDPDVWVMNADGSGARRLVDAPGDQRYPSLSPDGRRLVYRSDADGDADIWVAAADGTGGVPLTVNTTFDSAPAWSPDGSRIAFEAGPDATAAEGGAHYAE